MITDEIRFEVPEPRQKGGQQVHPNEDDRAVRGTHIPTGLIVECRSERSQHRNRLVVIAMIEAGLAVGMETGKFAYINEECTPLKRCGDTRPMTCYGTRKRFADCVACCRKHYPLSIVRDDLAEWDPVRKRYSCPMHMQKGWINNCPSGNKPCEDREI